MSETYVLVAAAATFAAVALAVGAVEAAVARRRRLVHLQRTVGEVAPPDLRREDLGRPLVRRLVLPAASGVAGLTRRLTPTESHNRLSRKLALAGASEVWDADRVTAVRVLVSLALAAGGVAVAVLVGLSPTIGAALALFLLLVGFFLPVAVVDAAADRRQTAIRRALPNTLDLLTISVEAGLGFDAALLHVTRKASGPLADEIGRLLHEMRLGVSRADAFRHLAARTDVPELRGFVLAMIQADVFGVSVAKVLRTQAQELRTRRRQEAEERAQKVPVKLVFPTVLCIFPSLFVVLLGPGVIRIARGLFGIG